MHSLSTSYFAYQIAKNMGFEGNELYQIYFGAVLHDIGKELIPTSIIDKPGKLTPSEFETMKKHPLYTYTILKDSVPRNVLNIASRHHE